MSYFIDGMKQYAVFAGRATRKQFWFFFLWFVIFSIIASIIDSMIGTSPANFGDNGLITGIFALATFLPYLGIAIRRLHDINKNGLWVLINLVPIIGTIYLIYLLAKSGDPGVNDYGAPAELPEEVNNHKNEYL